MPSRRSSLTRRKNKRSQLPKPQKKSFKDGAQQRANERLEKEREAVKPKTKKRSPPAILDFPRTKRKPKVKKKPKRRFKIGGETERSA